MAQLLAAELSEAAKSCSTFARSPAQHSLRRTESHLEESRTLTFARDSDRRPRTRCRVLVVRGTRRDVQRVCKLGRGLAADGVRGVDARKGHETLARTRDARTAVTRAS